MPVKQGVGRSPVRKNSRSGFTRAPGLRDQGFHRTEVILQSPSPDIRQVIIGARDPSVERFSAANVPGFLEFPGVDAEVPIGGPEEISQVVERHRLVDRQGAHDAEAQPFVDKSVKVRPWALVSGCRTAMMAVGVSSLPRRAA